MKKPILILAKSSKNKGYCVAGIDLETNKFVRLISRANTYNRMDDSLKDEDLKYDNNDCVEVGDVAEFEINCVEPTNYQTENVVMDTLSNPKKSILGFNDIRQLTRFLSSDDVIYGNTEPFIDSNYANNTIHDSIRLYKVKDLHIYKKQSDDGDRYKANFKYNGKIYYNFAVTDPKYKTTDKQTISDAVIMITLTPPRLDSNTKEYKTYKIVASIFELSGVLITTRHMIHKVLELEKNLKMLENHIKKYESDTVQTTGTGVQNNGADQLIKQLKDYRTRKSIEERVPAYIVFWDKALQIIVDNKNTIDSLDDILKLKYWSNGKVAKYGEDILSIIHSLE